MHAERPPRRLVAALAGLSCLLLPLLSHLPKASAATADGDPGEHRDLITSQQTECAADSGPSADFAVTAGIRSAAVCVPGAAVTGHH